MQCAKNSCDWYRITKDISVKVLSKYEGCPRNTLTFSVSSTKLTLYTILVHLFRMTVMLFAFHLYYQYQKRTACQTQGRATRRRATRRRYNCRILKIIHLTYTRQKKKHIQLLFSYFSELDQIFIHFCSLISHKCPIDNSYDSD